MKTVQNLSEPSSVQPGRESLPRDTKDQKSSQPESTSHVTSNRNNPDIFGNSPAELAANRPSSLLERWQRKFPHRKIEPHICTLCGRQFLQSVQLRKHMIAHASAEENCGSMEFPYTCYVCQRHFLFGNNSDLGFIGCIECMRC